MKPILYPHRGLRRAVLSAASLALSFTFTARAQSTPPFMGVDNNSNGISDLYEALYPLTGNGAADDDSDGISNQAEAAAGTSARSGSEFLNFSSVTNNGVTVTGSFKSIAGKRYQMQAQDGLGGAWTNEGGPIQGDGTVLTSAAPSTGGRMFVRLEVTDQDTDSDGVNDWEEIKVGTDRYLWDTDGDGFSDRSYVESLIASSSNVNIYAINSSVIEGTNGTFRITRSGGFLPLTIPLSIGGTATQGTDYNIPATSVTLPAGVTSATVTMTALPDATVESAETVIVTLQSGAGYTPGTSPSATITIVSQGLNGEYYNTTNGTHNFDPQAGANWDPAQLAMTRRDPAINFDWAGTAPAPVANDDVWEARWQGFIVPKYSELYQFHVTADRGVRVYCSSVPITGTTATQLRSDTWGGTTSPTTKYSFNALTGSAAFVADRAYYIRVDYRDSATNPANSNIQVSWSSASQAEEVIPSNRFTSENVGGAVPVITSPLFLTAISGAPFSYQIAASNSPTSFSASGLPAGLSVDAAGLITGTLSGTEGYHYGTISAANAAGSDAKNIVIYVATTGGGITREVWNSLTGTGVLSVPVHTTPTATTPLTSLSTAENLGDGFGDRIRGYITAPSSGLFTFFVTSDENAEVWIAASDEPATKLKRSFISYGNVGTGVWNAVGSQQSLPMMMQGGKRYYIEVIRRETSGTDHLQVGWLKPGQTGTPEVIPGWALTPYSPPAATNNNGYLYSAVLTPQTGSPVPSLGNGTALLRVNEDKTAADLTLTFGNLTGPITSSHIHDSRSIGGGSAGAPIFDVDDADPDHSDGLDPNEVYHWEIGATGNHTYADIIAAIEGGTAYLNLHTGSNPDGEIKGFFQPVIGSQSFVPPANPPPAELTLPSDPVAKKREVVRFLQQATFGAAPDRDGATDALPVNAPFGGWQADSIEAVQQLGYAGWIDAQMAMDRGGDPEVVINTLVPPTTVYQAVTNGRRTPNSYTNVGNGSGPMATYIRQYYEKYPRSALEPNGALLESANELWRAWWKLSCTAPDQIRHRVAFALSQILVVSEDGEFDERARWVSHYYDVLYYYGLDNFRTLLEKVTLNPTMGGYLDMLNNEKANPTTGYIPNENYAREIMQLFTIGLRRLHPDGTLVLDSGGLPVVTYQQDNVVGLASTLTGWRLAAGTGNWILPMLVTNASRHDFTDKLLLDEAYIPASSTQTIAQCDLELDQSHDLLFHHPNTGPFICRQLIQRMVTANPSPGYIYRVARVFADNGSGVRGDMKAVVKALLLDPEARNAAPRSQVGFGHLKEPVMRATQMIRAFRGYSLGETKPEFANANELGMALFSPAVNVDLTQPLPQRTDFWPDAVNDTGNRTLTAAVTATPATGSITLTLSGSTLLVNDGDYVRVDNEDFLVTAGAGGSTLTVNRAQRGTTAAAHAVGATVFRLRPYLDNYIDEMIDTDGAGPNPPALFSMFLQPGSLVLLRRQTTGSAGSTSNGETISPQNGLYMITADPDNAGRYKLTRTSNADSGPEVTKAFVMVSTSRREDGTLSGNRMYYQERTVTNIAADTQYWVYQAQTSTAKAAAIFSPAANIDIAAGLSSTTGSTRTATITENLNGTNYTFNVQTNNVILLRRQTTNPGHVNGEGNTSSPENGLYTVTNHATLNNRVSFVRNTGMDTAGEFVNASSTVTQIRMADGSLYPAVNQTSVENPFRVYRQELAVTTVGTDPVRWSSQVVGGATNGREAWGIGGTGSGTFNQTPLKSPTVFNFFEPDYVFLGNTGTNGLYGPEFQITSETSVVNTANWYVDLTRRNSSQTTSPSSYGQGFSYGDPFKRDVKLDLTYERGIAGDSTALLNHFETMLMPNQMTPRLKTLISNFLNTYAPVGGATADADGMNRIGEALYLLSLSPEYATQQ